MLSGLLSCAQINVLGLGNWLVDQQYPHCDKDVAETALIGDYEHIYAHGSGPDSVECSTHDRDTNSAINMATAKVSKKNVAFRASNGMPFAETGVGVNCVMGQPPRRQSIMEA